MTEHTCSTCQWWNHEYPWNFAGNPFGNCRLAQSTAGKPVHERAIAYASDEDAYKANLLTKPDFGCNQWEEKE